jgi:hypothetical protein
MTVKGTLIATLAAGYIATMAPSVHADDKAPAAKAEGEKASCKGPNGCKGEKKAKKGEHKDEKKDEKKAEKPAEEKK